MKTLLFILTIALLPCCKRNDSRYPYAIKDFSKTIRPHLYQIVSNGLVGVDYKSEMFVEDSIRIDELKKLAVCEHPLLRAVALRGLLKRDTQNENDIILSHLDDTAVIVVELSNWRASFTGTDFSSIADDMIKHSTWKSFSDRREIIDAVIMNHNYLNAAYRILDKGEPEEKYYESLKEMALRDREAKLIFNTIVSLSKFKTPGNFQFLKQFIEKNNEELKIPAFVLNETRDTVFFNHFDSLRNRIYKDGIEYQDTSKITWDHYEPHN